jgi:ABC-type Mn2+/Zn2+ transport system ATPase subunit
MGVSEVYVSITRIQKFLEFPERPDLQQSLLLDNNNNNNNDIMDDNEKGDNIVNDDANDDGNATSNNKNNSNDDDIVISISNVDCYWNYVQQATAATTPATTELLSITDESADASKISEGKKEEDNDHHGNDQDTDNSVTSSLISALSDINLDLHRGRLTCVIGTVGSGKSALLQAVVGELPVHRGHITRRYDNNNNGKHLSSDEIIVDNDNDNNKHHHRDHHHEGGGISYAAQDPWIMDGTVRENVTMGLPFNFNWYNEVIDACGLRMDFQIFLHGDSTIVGDRGVQCSGGQRSRIGLARAIYRDSDVLIADDPLSAVDAKVGRQIYHEALLGLCTRRGKCVLLATHQHQYVHDHRCVLLLNGQIECIGSYTDCIDAAGGRLSIQEADDILDDVDNLATEESIEGDVIMDTSSKISASCDSTFSNGNNDESSTKDMSKELVGVEEDGHDTRDDAAANLVDEATDDSKEDNSSGVVQWDTYYNYIQAMGGFWTAAFILLTFCVTQAIAIWTIITFGEWAELPQKEQGSGKILGLIIGQGFLAIFLATFRAFYCFDMTIKASKVLHDDMAKAVLRAR